MPKPRRRHSALIVSGSLIMFGGFDGGFYNDMHIMDFQKQNKQSITISPSTIDKEYAELINCSDNSDVVFQLDNAMKSTVYAHKSLILFRSIERELLIDGNEDHQIKKLLKSKGNYHISNNLTPFVDTSQICKFVKSVFNAKKGEIIHLKGVSDKAAFTKLLEFLYCDRFVENTCPS